MKDIIKYLYRYKVIIISLLLSFIIIILFTIIMTINVVTNNSLPHYDNDKLNLKLINMIDNKISELYLDDDIKINKIISINSDSNYLYVSADGKYNDINILYNVTLINSDHLDINNLLININEDYIYQLDNVYIYSYSDIYDFTQSEIFIDNLGSNIKGKVSKYNDINYYSGIIQNNNQYDVYYLLKYESNSLYINKVNSPSINSIYYSYISYLYSLNI